MVFSPACWQPFHARSAPRPAAPHSPLRCAAAKRAPTFAGAVRRPPAFLRVAPLFLQFCLGLIIEGSRLARHRPNRVPPGPLHPRPAPAGRCVIPDGEPRRRSREATKGRRGSCSLWGSGWLRGARRRTACPQVRGGALIPSEAGWADHAFFISLRRRCVKEQGRWDFPDLMNK